MLNSTVTDQPANARTSALSTRAGAGPAPVLKVDNLEVTYYTDAGRAKALDDVSFTLHAGEKLGMVGESGSGKSTLALAMMRMIKPPGRIEGGSVLVGDVDLILFVVEAGSFTSADERVLKLLLSTADRRVARDQRAMARLRQEANKAKEVAGPP